MEQKTTTRCAEQTVQTPGLWHHYHQCARKGVVEEDGKKWCRQHAPSAIKARQKASSERWERNFQIRMAPYNEAKHLRAVNAQLLAALERIRNPGTETPAMGRFAKAQTIAHEAIKEARK